MQTLFIAIGILLFVVIPIRIVLYLRKKRLGSRVSTSVRIKIPKNVLWVTFTLAILVLADWYIPYTVPDLWSWFASGTGIAPIFVVFVFALHVWAVYATYKRKPKTVFLLILCYVLASLLLSRWFFNPEDQNAMKRYKAYEPCSTALVSARKLTQASSDSLWAKENSGSTSGGIIRPDGEIYSVVVPFRYDAVEIETLRLNVGDRLVPLYSLVVNARLPGQFSKLNLTGLGAVQYYQENGKPFYMGVQNMPEAIVWIGGHKSHDYSFTDFFVRNDEEYQPFAKNDNSVFASLQMQLNGNWEWVHAPLILPPADSTQPIILGANLQREVGHEGVSGYYRLVFYINHPPAVDTAAEGK